MGKMKKKSPNQIYSYLIVSSVTLFVCCCFWLVKSYQKNAKDRYDFSRLLYPKEFIVKTNSIFDSLDTQGKTLYSYDNYILLKESSVSMEKDFCSLIDSHGKEIKQIIIPERTINIIAYMNNFLYWLSNYELKFLDSTKRESIVKSFSYTQKIINAIPINKHKFLTLDIDTIQSKGSVSFSVCTIIDNNSFKRIGNIELPLNNYKKFPEKALAYSGVFLKTFKHITYSFSHLPYIYVFDNNGNFITVIKTKDNVPPPSIIQYKNYFIFERGKSFNSNVGSFVYENNVCVFSYHSSLSGKYVIDCYDLSSGKYNGSIFISNQRSKRGNKMIDEIISTSEHILINSNGTLTTLTFNTPYKE